jgi:hypothetical protein
MGICLVSTLLLSVSLQCVAFGQSNLGFALSFCNGLIGYGCDALIRGFRLGVGRLLGKVLRCLGLGLLPLSSALALFSAASLVAWRR